MRRTLFRYRSFNTEKLNDYSYIHQRIINIEKWKFEAFEGLVYPSSPLYFNDPYDCEFCFQSDALEGVLDRETYIHLLERRFSLKQEEKNRILYSDNIERAMQIVLQAHGGRLSDSWMNILQNGLNDCMSTIKDVWSYEKEWRIVTANFNKVMPEKLKCPNGKYVLDLKENIKAFYLGAKISENFKEEIIQFGKKNSIDIYQMVLSPSTYELNAKKII